ncbi:hypothetical protein [Ligilactobacillus pobuzihii]|uniref:Uncharacterized protein n=1 Tax=Ligilactobacillus pobuzihii TaxID=449659 RepID=A0A0R2LC91_9LACO|nr:hypothetical protein [Ligilactobacillus pobuzihii]KRK10973.1 hypothetical protein FD11_GL001243 [Ligilactobacillus pobuzihii E100301 = KCTC 13174]KRN99518.1 hypothetical protein IV66_GL001522 [Ligilactobacillus pobuzihii]GEN48960.1 hypothetical protein LPO01_17520 [Ligilactobacillus pobuzihii]
MAKMAKKVNYRDPTHIVEADDVDESKLPESAKKLATWIREKMYGVDVRETIARIIEQVFAGYFDDQKVAQELQKLADRLSDEWKDTIAGDTDIDELKNARIDINGKVYKTLKERLDAMQKEMYHLIYAADVANKDARNLRLNGFTTSSLPLKYEVQKTVSGGGDSWELPLIIQPVSKISYVKVSEIK